MGVRVRVRLRVGVRVRVRVRVTSTSPVSGLRRVRGGNAKSLTAMMTSRKEIGRSSLSVCPCLISGSPLAPPGPSQQSSSRQRQPMSSTRSYISMSDLELIWLPG